MFKIKTDGNREVKLQGLNTIMVLAVMVIKDAYAGFGVDCVITSALDGKHSRGSKHYSGNALDFRIRDLSKENAVKVHSEIKNNLGPEFDVILEKDHIHVEFHPKDPL